jgi:type I restriction enzyme R subunit
VCHSKNAAIRYQTFIDQALTDRLKLEKDKAVVDAELVARIAFLKAAVMISSYGTNEAASVTRVHKQAKAWNAVEDFCKPFDLDDPDKECTGIAFLIVCDMLLTGFDAAIQ